LLYLGGIYTTLKNYTTFKKSLSTSNNHNYDNNTKPLSISIQSSQNIVNGRGTSTVTAIAYDANTDKKIDNAIVKLMPLDLMAYLFISCMRTRNS
jgi:hypothetical protein